MFEKIMGKEGQAEIEKITIILDGGVVIETDNIIDGEEGMAVIVSPLSIRANGRKIKPGRHGFTIIPQDAILLLHAVYKKGAGGLPRWFGKEDS